MTYLPLRQGDSERVQALKRFVESGVNALLNQGRGHRNDDALQLVLVILDLDLHQAIYPHDMVPRIADLIGRLDALRGFL